MLEQSIMDMRGLVSEGTVVAVHDAGQVQTVDVMTLAGLRSGIEVAQIFGLSSQPKLDGAKVLLLAVGGDVANLRALPVGNPARRFGGTAQGESVLYGDDGSRLAVRNGGTIEILGAAHVVITSPDVTITTTGVVTINATGGVTINGNAVVSGDVSDGHGKLSGLRGHYNTHTHHDSHSDVTGVPDSGFID